MAVSIETRILVVDDESEYFDALCDVAELCRHQFRVICRRASSCGEAVSLIPDWRPSVVIMDLRAGVERGGELISYCKGGSPELIALCPEEHQVTDSKQASLPMSTLWPKTSDPEELEVLLRRVVEMSESEYDLH